MSKAVHVINFGYKVEYNVGRRITNDITVSDISVSREQAKIRLCGKRVYLCDSMSKFGTFVLVKGLLPLATINSRIPIQIEKKCFFLTLRNKYTWQQRLCQCIKGSDSRDLKGAHYDCNY